MRASAPDYLAADEDRRWPGSLSELWTVLRREAAQDQGTLSRAWRVLPDGILVSLTIDPETFRKTLRFSRSTRPDSADAAEAFAREVRALSLSFPLRGRRWHEGPDPRAKGIAFLLRELYAGEISPGTARCYVCGRPCAWEAAYAPDGCACPGCVPATRGSRRSAGSSAGTLSLFDAPVGGGR